MGLLDSVSTPRQQVAYLFPEVTSGNTPQGVFPFRQTLQELFVFQFWPSQVTDSYTPNWATKQIPGASHPLYQWVSGSGRNISFTANFVAEIKEAGPLDRPFNERIAAASATSISPSADALSAAFLPSSRYVVNVAAALAALQRYLYPSYNSPKGITKPPKKLILVLPGTKLGRADNVDGILCILKAANVTMESWFPSGELRAASVGLQFSEIIQYTAGSGTAIRYIGAETYDKLANKYTITASVGSTPDGVTRRRVS
jgi:hypothetical protein